MRLSLTPLPCSAHLEHVVLLSACLKLLLELPQLLHGTHASRGAVVRQNVTAAAACPVAANGRPLEQFRQHVKDASATAIVACAALTVLHLHRQVTGERKEHHTLWLLCSKEAHSRSLAAGPRNMPAHNEALANLSKHEKSGRVPVMPRPRERQATPVPHAAQRRGHSIQQYMLSQPS